MDWEQVDADQIGERDIQKEIRIILAERESELVRGHETGIAREQAQRDYTERDLKRDHKMSNDPISQKSPEDHMKSFGTSNYPRSSGGHESDHEYLDGPRDSIYKHDYSQQNQNERPNHSNSTQHQMLDTQRDQHPNGSVNSHHQ
ncbi:hypothetical protein CROQUDRAFT_131760 [Cronartium quercuum f. sp. fusiforme G11]|uniref:Uncharacterized protein n=1 Tax=Cronartium quercuum f. sp. fusiforme G11 TaxID=708437 RepID=A0A9P6TEC2_9BASI|nr:hypothetical protein CROQUDRAFT_131760 [Cronartium quercuum f. sp. fusiforme G11]